MPFFPLNPKCFEIGIIKKIKKVLILCFWWQNNIKVIHYQRVRVSTPLIKIKFN